MQLSYDSKTFTLTCEYWTGTYPIEALSNWVEILRTGEKQFPDSVNSYTEARIALENLANEVGV